MNKIEDGMDVGLNILTNADGNSLQCNVKNGGDNQRAQLLVPADKLNMAWRAFFNTKEVSPHAACERAIS